MAEPTTAAPGRIFISYRREDTDFPAGWLYERLADHFDGGQIFKDVDSIQLGDDFVEVITTAVGSCDVLLAVIGDRWLTITDEDGQRRLDNSDDFVRLEIEAALARNVRVIPILVDGARIPRAEELPDSLTSLVRRQALELSPTRFDADTSRLLTVLDRTLSRCTPRRWPRTPLASSALRPNRRRCLSRRRLNRNRTRLSRRQPNRRKWRASSARRPGGRSPAGGSLPPPYSRCCS
jgi:hypothetical protein